MSIQLKVRVLKEPELEFGGKVFSTEPKIGLIDGGPFSLNYGSGFPGAVRLGFVGPPEMIEAAQQWFNRCKNGILTAKDNRRRHPDFPPFQKIFRVPLEVSSQCVEEISQRNLISVLSRPSQQQFDALLDVYEEGIDHLTDRELAPNVILCSLSDEFLAKFRNWSVGGTPCRRKQQPSYSQSDPQQLRLFQGIDESNVGEHQGLAYRTFRRALKAKAMRHKKPIQLAHNHLFVDGPTRDDPATRAWDVCVALFYKAGGIPWRLAAVSPNVCFVGISFHHLRTTERHEVFSSMAQAFSTDIEGFVLRGDRVEWDKNGGHSPHLNRDQSSRLGEAILDEYTERTGRPPIRIVIHKRSRFDTPEIDGFQQALNAVAQVEYVVLYPSEFQLIPQGNYPPRRGTLATVNDTSRYLYTTGFFENWASYPGPYVPEPMEVRLQGEGEPERACREILALTKMNFNSASPLSWAPITTRMAGEVGPIMAEFEAEFGEVAKPEMPYRYYM